MRTDLSASSQLVALHERRGCLPRRFSYRAKAWPGAPKGTGRVRERLRCRRSSPAGALDEQAWRTEEPGVRASRTRLENELGVRARDLISKLHAELRNKSRNFSPYCVIRHAGCRVGRRIRCHAGCRVGRRIRCHAGCRVGRRIRCHAGYLVGRRKRCRVSCLVEGRVGCRMGRRAGWHVE